MRIARNAINDREARTRSASEKFRPDVRGRNTLGTFDKPLACVTDILCHVFGKPLTWIAHKFTYTFDPLLTASKGVYTPFTGVHRWVKTAFTTFDLGGIQRWSLMRVKNHQKRAKVAFTKPLTIHLMPCKGNFSCRVYVSRYFWIRNFFFPDSKISPSACSVFKSPVHTHPMVSGFTLEKPGVHVLPPHWFIVMIRHYSKLGNKLYSGC